MLMPPALQIRKAPRDMQVRVSAKNTSAVGEKFTVAFTMYPIGMKTVTNATFTGVIPDTLSINQMTQSISTGETAALIDMQQKPVHA